MTASTWTESDSAVAATIWANYQRHHDLSACLGKTAGIDPHTGRVWIGDSIHDVLSQRDADGIDTLEVEGQDWPAIIDTGFNGDLELPEALLGKLNDQPAGRLRSALAAGRVVEEDAYSVEFPF